MFVFSRRSTTEDIGEHEYHRPIDSGIQSWVELVRITFARHAASMRQDT